MSGTMATAAPTAVGAGPARALRVLTIAAEYPREGRPYTTEFVRRQVESLRAHGVDIAVFGFDGGQRPLNYLRAWWRLRQVLATGQFDLIHAQFGQSGLLAFGSDLPLVVTFRGDDLQGIVADESGRLTWKGRLLRRLSHWVAGRADHAIVVAEHMAALIPTGTPVTVVPSGLDLERFRPMPQADARRQLGLPADRRLVLFVGRDFEPRKRFGLARTAVDIVNDSLPTEMIVAWGVKHSEIPVYMSACDALVFTSIQEGSPNAVKEALACDLPVVSVPVGDVAERLRGVAGCEVCPDERPEAIAAALERVLRRGRRVDGRAAVAQLAEANMTARVLAVYDSVLRRRANGTR